MRFGGPDARSAGRRDAGGGRPRGGRSAARRGRRIIRGAPRPAAIRPRSPSGSRGEGGEQLLGPQPELLADDRRVASTRSVPSRAQAHRPAPAGRAARARRRALPGGGGPGQAQLLLEAEAPRRLGQQVADPARLAPARDRSSSSGRAGARVPAHRPRPDEPGPERGVRDAPPRPSPMARSAGSRSSSVVVVMRAWGSAAIRRTRWLRRAGSSSLNTSSSRRSGGRPSRLVRRSSSASLRARIAVRCWPREANVGQVAAPSSSKTRSSRCGPDQRRCRSRPPCRPSRRGAGRARRGSTRRAGPGRSSRSAGSADPSSGAISRGRPPAARRAPRAGPPARRPRSPRRRRAAARPRSGARRASGLLLADRPQQAVALRRAPGRTWRGRPA